MFELIAMHVMIFATILTSVAGGICILSGKRIFNLNVCVRNMMYVGACIAMCFGLLGAFFCVGSITATAWHFVAALVLGVIGFLATVHVSVDLNDRLIS